MVNALSDWMEVEVARDKRAHTMRFERGKPVTKLKDAGAVNRRGTTVSFHPDGQIFGTETHFSAARLYRMVKSKAYLYRGVEIRWSCDPSLVKGETPAEDTLKFPGGLLDFLRGEVEGKETVTPARVLRPHREPRRPEQDRGCGRMGGGVDARDRRLHPFLLQHHPDPAGAAPTSRAFATR